jgi:hypothetical protein
VLEIYLFEGGFIIIIWPEYLDLLYIFTSAQGIIEKRADFIEWLYNDNRLMLSYHGGIKCALPANE